MDNIKQYFKAKEELDRYGKTHDVYAEVKKAFPHDTEIFSTKGVCFGKVIGYDGEYLVLKKDNEQETRMWAAAAFRHQDEIQKRERLKNRFLTPRSNQFVFWNDTQSPSEYDSDEPHYMRHAESD